MPQENPNTSYNDLITLFYDFRKYQEPPVHNEVYDYSPDTMKEQELKLPDYRARLDAIDTTGWTISQKVDLELVRAEMNGLEFDHRTLRPWEKDPCFWSAVESGESDVPAREAPRMHGTLELWKVKYPLDDEQRDLVERKVRAIPAIVENAKKTLILKGKDLCLLGMREKKSEVRALGHLAEKVKDTNPELVPLIDKAREAVDDFRAWLEDKYAALPDSYDGIGVEEFDWSMKYVHLVPFDWKEQGEMIRRELERSWTSLKLEEHRNRTLPPLMHPKNVEEMCERVEAAYPEFMDFLSEQDVFTVPEYMGLKGHRPHALTPAEHMDFFHEVEYRHLLPLRCHMVHWLEKQREAHNTHPIRKVPLLYNLWDSRAEGFATAFEETMLQSGLMDKEPRARELVYILLAFRAARAIGDLKMHSREFTLKQAVDYTVRYTPKGWLRADRGLGISDLGLYLKQPGYGTSYVIGKIQFDQLIADRAMQIGDGFMLKAFLDEYFEYGIIPASLIRWEMTGLDNEMRQLGIVS